MKTLMVYYSFTGNNEALARKLQQSVSCDIVRIQVQRNRNSLSILLDLIFKRMPRLRKYNIPFFAYEHIIFVAPVWAGKIATPMLAFLKKEAQNIPDYSFITLCGGAAGQKEKIYGFLESSMLRKPVAIEELWLNDLMTTEEKDQVRHGTLYRVKEEDWNVFDAKISRFLELVGESTKEVGV